MAVNRHEVVRELILNQKERLEYAPEDEKLLLKLWDAYWKKKKGDLKGDASVLACAILWRYSSDNYLWEDDNQWRQKDLAELFSVRGKTVGNNASDIRDALKMGLWDDRFCRKSVAENNPMKKMVVLTSGFILPKEIAMEKGLSFVPFKKDKSDYYYEGCGWLEARQGKKAIYCFKKALEIDEEYVEALNGLGTAYWLDNFDRSKEYFQKAYELTLKNFKGTWPKELLWGILKNRQYLRAIHYTGLVCWREGNNDLAMKNFKLLLQLNPDDNQGARYLVASLYAGQKWEDSDDEDMDKEEKLLEEMNKEYGFWKEKG